MRKIIAFFAALILTAVGFSACSRGGEPFSPRYDGTVVPINQRDVITTNRVTNQSFLDMLAYMREYQPGAQSRTVVRQQAYRSHWYRVVYVAYPRFDDLHEIDRYYGQRHRDSIALHEVEWLDVLDEIADSTDQVIQYFLQVYAMTMLESHVVVRFRQDMFADGEISTKVMADVFDRNSGEKLGLGDVIDLQTRAEEINLAVADHLRVRDITPHERFDVLQAQEQQFMLTQQGVVLLFSPGELAPALHGVIEITVG